MPPKKTTDLDFVIDQTRAAYLVESFLNGLNESSRPTYKYSLDTIARNLGYANAHSFDWSQLRVSHVSKLRKDLLDHYSRTTTHKHMAAVFGVLKKATRLRWPDPQTGDKMMSADDYMEAVEAGRIKLSEKPRAATGRMLTPDEITALLKTTEKGSPKRAARDRAIISVLCQIGARRAEIGKVMLEDYVHEYAEDPRIGAPIGRLLLHGKGEKDRIVYVKNGTRDDLAAWLEIRGNQPGALFHRILNSDEAPPDSPDGTLPGMSAVSIWAMVRDRGRAAGLDHFSTHDLRRTFTSEALARGVDVLTVGSILGHTDPKITAGYDRRGEQRKMDAIA